MKRAVRSLMRKTLLRQEVAFFDRDANSPSDGIPLGLPVPT